MTNRNSVRRIFTFVLLAVIALAIAPAARALGPHGDAFVGYSNIWDSNRNLSGWDAALHFKVAPFVGVEGDFSGYGPSNSSTAYLFLAGPRVTVGARGVHAFAHGLIGGSRRSSGSVGASGFTIALGGGLDFHVVSRLSWRVSGDYLDAPLQSRAYAGRVSTGPVFRF